MGHQDGDGSFYSSIHYKLLGGILGIMLGTAALVGLLVQFGAGDRAIQLLSWIETLGPWGPLVFIGVMAVVVVFLLPGLPFTLGSGFLFGLLPGTVYVVVGTTIGAVLAFLIGHYCLRNRVETWLFSHPKAKNLRDAFHGKGWRVVLLIRLVPFFPSKLANYVFGLLDFRLPGFSLGTCLGIIPFSLTNVYIGCMAAQLTLASVRDQAVSPLQWIVYGLGFAITLFTVIYMAGIAQKALQEQ